MSDEELPRELTNTRGKDPIIPPKSKKMADRTQINISGSMETSDYKQDIEKSRRRKEEESFSEDSSVDFELPSEVGNVSAFYTKTRIVLLPIDPYLIHAYWDISSDKLDEAKHRLGNDYDESKGVLRFYDITNIIFDGRNAHSSFDVHINVEARNWYIRLWSPEKSYFAELGIKTKNNIFLVFARSNIVQIPRSEPSNRGGKRYMFVGKASNLRKTALDSLGSDITYDRRHMESRQREKKSLPSVEGKRQIEQRRSPGNKENLLNDEIHGEAFEDTEIIAVEPSGKAEIRKSSVRAVNGFQEKGTSKKRKVSSEVKIDQTIDLVKDFYKRLSELYHYGTSQRSVLKREIQLANDTSFERKGEGDLTEINERSFKTGISSRQC